MGMAVQAQLVATSSFASAKALEESVARGRTGCSFRGKCCGLEESGLGKSSLWRPWLPHASVDWRQVSKRTRGGLRVSAMGTTGEKSKGEGRSLKAVIMEMDGVVADLHRQGHRDAFNVVFRELNFDCANWSEPVYADLLRLGGSDEAMVGIFFSKIGWPLSLPTSERGAFVANVIKEKRKALIRLALQGSILFRPGFEQFVDEAVGEGVGLAVVTTNDRCGQDVARALLSQLGEGRARHVAVIGEAEVERSMYRQVAIGAESSSGAESELAAQISLAVAAEKQRVAGEVAALLSSVGGPVSVEIDTGNAPGSPDEVAALRAAAEVLSVPFAGCLTLVGSHRGVQAAVRAQLPCVVVRSSVTSRAEFRGAKAVLEDFGEGGGVTIPRLQKILTR